MTDIKSKLEELLDGESLRERCGLVLRDGTIIEIDNIAADPEQGFRMAPSQLLDHIDQAVATWHTHPASSGNLSQEDYAGFLQWPGLYHYVVGHGGDVRLYTVERGLVLAS